jgi:hypothetical protein
VQASLWARRLEATGRCWAAPVGLIMGCALVEIRSRARPYRLVGVARTPDDAAGYLALLAPPDQPPAAVPPDPRVVALGELRAADPALSQRAAAQRLGVSRTWVYARWRLAAGGAGSRVDERRTP